MATPITESMWTRHKAEIEKLYCDDNWTRKDVDKFMREKHGFCASKWQYEAQFKRWKFRKNYSPGTWKEIERLKRQNGSSSVIKYHGRALPPKKVKKGTSRYKTSEVPCYALSPGFTSDDVHMTTSSSLVRAQLSPLYFTPSIQIMKLFSSRFDPSFLPRGSRYTFANPVPVPEDQSIEAVIPAHPELGVIETSCRAATGNPSFVNLEAMLPLNALGWADMSPSVVASRSSQAQMMGYPQVSCVKLYAIIHALSNEMVFRLGFENLGQVWRYVRENYSTSIQDVLRDVFNNSYSQDLRHRIVQAAIEAGDAIGVRQLIRLWDINVDDVVCYGTRRQAFSAVELASGLVHNDVLEVLLEEGADITATVGYGSSDSCSSGRGVLYWLLHSVDLIQFLNTSTKNPSSRFDPQYKYKFRDSGSWTENAIGVIRQLAASRADMLSQVALQRWPDYEHDTVANHPWTLEDLKQLHSHTRNTHLSWLFEKFVLQRLRTVSSDAHDHNLEIVRWCVPDSANTGHGHVQISPLVEPSILLFEAIRMHSNPSALYLVGLGFELTTPDNMCTCGTTLGLCLQMTLWSDTFAPFIPPALKPVEPCEHEELLAKLLGSINHGHARAFSHVLEHEMKANPKAFWETMIVPRLTKTGLRTSDRLFATGEDVLLRVALRQGNRDDVAQLLSIRQTQLKPDASMILDAWRSRDRGIHTLLLEATSGFGKGSGSRDEDKWGPIFKSFDHELLEFLDANNIEVSPGPALFRVACSNGDERLMQRYIDLTRTSPLHEYSIIRPYIAQNAAKIEILLNYIPRRGWKKIVESFKAYIINAVCRGDSDTVRSILKQNIVIELYARSSLRGTTLRRYRREKSLFERLLDVHSSQNDEAFRLVLRKYGKSSMSNPMSHEAEAPLLHAIRHGVLEIVKTLVLQYQFSIHLPATCGRRRTALQTAAEHGHYDIVKWLLDNGADVNESINQRGGATALQLASIEGYGGIMELLINRGADLDALGAIFDGRTALEGAAEHGRLDAVKLLLDSRPENTCADKMSLERARRRAKGGGYTSIVKLLDDYWEVHRLRTVREDGITQGESSLSDGEVALEDEDKSASQYKCPCFTRYF